MANDRKGKVVPEGLRSSVVRDALCFGDAAPVLAQVDSGPEGPPTRAGGGCGGSGAAEG